MKDKANGWPKYTISGDWHNLFCVRYGWNNNALRADFETLFPGATDIQVYRGLVSGMALEHVRFATGPITDERIGA